eukprot:TRINITY_DN4203_c0_g1_i2.p1 TRINITY_DN4203_c0_g1~~TRINITY_DN4203_c0_g1_i2.p1  ORF type:complete len:168 (+),score=16.16 TRINITY_DN4203_c0_g1_i2:23-505(+)
MRLAPISIPVQRRLETLAVTFFVVFQLFCIIFSIWLLLFPFTMPFMILYILYIYHDQTPFTGGRRSEWVRKSFLFRKFRNYFPIKVVKTAELSPDRNYIIGYHPHGIIGMGAFTNFATEATGISEVFPGIEFSLLTLAINFRVPFYREYLLSLGYSNKGL